MRKQPQVTEQTRANLRQAFWELYAERPVEKISVREITDRAGYNRATFYLYYHDVYELLEEIEDMVLGNIERLVQGRLLQGDTLDFSQHMGLILRLAQRDEQASRVVREFYLSGILAIIRIWTAEDDPMPIDQLIQLVMRIVQ